MFYQMYLSGICNRRQWPDPRYESWFDDKGHHCRVRVNNREYCTDLPYRSEGLARDNAAMKAWMICRNFSANDGMIPGQRLSGNGIIQGRPAAIGAGRPSKRDSSSSSDGSSSSSNSPRSSGSDFDDAITLRGDSPRSSRLSELDGITLNGDSPRSSGNDFDARLSKPMHAYAEPPLPRRSVRSEPRCACRRGYPVVACHRCALCLPYAYHR